METLGMYGRLDTMKKIFLYFKLISTVNMASCEKGKEVEVWANFLLTLRMGGGQKFGSADM